MLPDTRRSVRANRERRRRTIAAMATTVTVEVVHGAGDDPHPIEAALDRALGWFDVVERTCSRFVETSELSRLTRRIGTPVPASALLSEALRLALAAADATGGAFDPTIGAVLAGAGFDRDHRTGARRDGVAADRDASFRDVIVDTVRGTILIQRPLVLDLGAVAKGMAVDLAARELEPFRDFAVDAGGDLFLGGVNVDGEPWSIGIRHPREAGAVIETVRASNVALCTSGDYERRQPGSSGHHIVDARTGVSPADLASVTVRASSAAAADVLATSAFLLGPVAGQDLLDREGVGGLLFTPALERVTTTAW